LDTSILENAGVNTETMAVTPGEGRYSLDFLNPTQPGQMVLYPPPTGDLPGDNSPTGLMTAFYTFFFPNHSFLLPRIHMIEYLAKNHLVHLNLAIQYVGALYVTTANRQTYEELLNAQFNDPLVVKDGTHVQALLLYAIGLHVNDKEDESCQYMYMAVNLALQLGLNNRLFALTNGGAHTMLEESWRRTWWELYVIDGMFAGVNPKYVMQLREVPVSVALPCEEADYFNGVSARPFQSRLFSKGYYSD
jgi:hypothetical protein